jgi:hypothetical protein
LLAVALLTFTGCSGAVRLDPPDPPINADTCADFVARLPEMLADQQARQTDPTSELTAAWGDPPITVRCGVPDPTTLTASAQLFRIDGVDWFPEQDSSGYVFTTYQRQANVQVTVPDAYSPESGPVTELSTLVKQTIPPLHRATPHP